MLVFLQHVSWEDAMKIDKIVIIISLISTAGSSGMLYPPTDASQEEWLHRATLAIKDGHAARLEQAMLNLKNARIKDALYRDIHENKPRYYELKKAALRSGLIPNLKVDKKTLLSLVGNDKDHPELLELLLEHQLEDEKKPFVDEIKLQELLVSSQTKVQKYSVISRSSSGAIQRSLKGGIPPP